MNRYESSSHRALFGVAAMGMTAITFSLLIGAPAALDCCGQDAYVAVASPQVAPAATEVVVGPTVIEIIAVRESPAAAAGGGANETKRGQRG